MLKRKTQDESETGSDVKDPRKENVPRKKFTITTKKMSIVKVSPSAEESSVHTAEPVRVTKRGFKITGVAGETASSARTIPTTTKTISTTTKTIPVTTKALREPPVIPVTDVIVRKVLTSDKELQMPKDGALHVTLEFAENDSEKKDKKSLFGSALEHVRRNTRKDKEVERKEENEKQEKQGVRFEGVSEELHTILDQHNMQLAKHYRTTVKPYLYFSPKITDSKTAKRLANFLFD